MQTPRLEPERLRQWIDEHATTFGLRADQVSEMLEHVSLDEVQERLHEKDGVRRFLLGLHVTADLLANGPCLVRGSSEERQAAFLKLATHAAATWLGATRLYEAGAHPLAAAISITALEETGKLAVERFRLVGVKSIDMAGLPPPESLGGRASAASFFSHTDKHVLAAMSGALVNNRLDRVLGVDYINWFLEAAELGALERLRQNCLYAEMDAGNLQVPSDVISAGNGARLVALAGEVLAEVAGVEPGVWDRLLTEVQAFEKSVGLPSQ